MLSDNDNTKSVGTVLDWNYGIESWCSLEGQYTTITADMSGYGSTAYHVSICNLGIMGTKYERVPAIATAHTV